jgi:hypothetical protein
MILRCRCAVLPSVCDKSVIARFDGGMLSSNAGALAEVEKRLRMADRLARCIAVRLH